MAELFTLEDLAAIRGAEQLEGAAGMTARSLATGAVRGFCAWHVAPVQTDELTLIVQAGSGYVRSGELVAGVSGDIFLPTLRLLSAPIITLADASVVTDFSWQDHGHLSRVTGWGAVDDLITVEFTHGYDAGSFQHELVKGVALGVAARVLSAPNDDAQTLSAALLQSEENQLNPYRLQTIV